MKQILTILCLFLSIFVASAQPYPGPQGGRHGGPFGQRGDHMRPEIPCEVEWQPLWNGCHVRLMGQQVRIFDDHNNSIVWGDEIRLLPNGCYKVRRGDYWRIYDREGVTTSVYGHEILFWWNGCYCVRFNDLWKVYDREGSFLNVWSRESIDLLPNGYYVTRINGRCYVADPEGDRLTGVWGDEIDLMPNGLFRCTRNNRYYYYDTEGNRRN